MIRLVISLFFAPFWVHFILAGGVVGVGAYVSFADTQSHVEIERMAKAPAPDVVPIGDFSSDKTFYLPVEVNVSAQIAMDHKVRLVETKNGRTTSERLMFILVAPDATSDARMAYGAVILDPSELDRFAGWVALKSLIGGQEGSQGPVLQFDGMVDNPSDKSHIKSALKNQGYMAAKDFLYIAPFFEGRAAAFAKELEDEPLTLTPFVKFAGVFVLAGLVRLLLGVFSKGKRGAVVAKAPETPVVSARPATVMPAPDLPRAPVVATSSDNDFIGALARKRQVESEAFAAPADMPPAIVSTRPLGDNLVGAMGRSLGGLGRKIAGGMAALVLYLVLMNFSGSLGMPGAISLTGENAPQMQAPMAVATPRGENIIVLEPLAPATAPVTLGAPVPQVAAPVVPQVEAPKAIPAPQPTAGFMSGAFDFAWAKAKAQLLVWQAAPPLWLIAAILATLILVPALVLLRGMCTLNPRRKDRKIDPFERLLQRRLAEQARLEGVAMGG